MTQPMTDEEKKELREYVRCRSLGYEEVGKCLDEIDRLAVENDDLKTSINPLLVEAHMRRVTNTGLSTENDTLREQLAAMREACINAVSCLNYVEGSVPHSQRTALALIERTLLILSAAISAPQPETRGEVQP